MNNTDTKYHRHIAMVFFMTFHTESVVQNESKLSAANTRHIGARHYRQTDSNAITKFFLK